MFAKIRTILVIIQLSLSTLSFAAHDKVTNPSIGDSGAITLPKNFRLECQTNLAKAEYLELSIEKGQLWSKKQNLVDIVVTEIIRDEIKETKTVGELFEFGSNASVKSDLGRIEITYQNNRYKVLWLQDSQTLELVCILFERSLH